MYTFDPADGEGLMRRLALEEHEDWVRGLDWTVFPASVSSSSDEDADEAGKDLMLARWESGRVHNECTVHSSLACLARRRIACGPNSRRGCVAADGPDDLNDAMIDAFERRMTGDAASATSRSATQLSTKAQMMKLADGS